MAAGAVLAEGTPILEGANFSMIDSMFGHFYIQLGTYFMVQSDLMTSKKEISLYLSHLIPEIIEPKLRLTFHKTCH